MTKRPDWYYQGMEIAKRNAEQAGIPLGVYLAKITKDLEKSIEQDNKRCLAHLKERGIKVD